VCIIGRRCAIILYSYGINIILYRTVPVPAQNCIRCYRIVRQRQRHIIPHNGAGAGFCIRVNVRIQKCGYSTAAIICYHTTPYCTGTIIYYYINTVASGGGNAQLATINRTSSQLPTKSQTILLVKPKIPPRTTLLQNNTGTQYPYYCVVLPVCTVLLYYEYCLCLYCRVL
jgi:hypothetical protein